MSLDNLAAQRRCVHEAFFEFAGVLKIIVFLTEDHKNGPFDQVAWPGQKRRRAPWCAYCAQTKKHKAGMVGTSIL